MLTDRPETHWWLLDMPNATLHGQAAGIEKWCHDNGKVRPTLLDLCLARDASPRR